MKKILLILSAITGLVGCINTTNSLPRKTQMEFKVLGDAINPLTTPNFPDEFVRFSPISGLQCNADVHSGKVYLVSGSRCKITNPASELTVEYTRLVMPRRPSNVPQYGYKDALKRAQLLPPSAWRTYTIYPRQIVEKGQAQYLSNKSYYDRTGMGITLTLYIDANGNITEEVNYKALPGRTWEGG